MRKKGRAAHPPASPALAVGVDMGGTNLRAAVIDSTGQILHHLRLTSPIVDPLMGRQVLLQAIQEVTAQAVIRAEKQELREKMRNSGKELI